MFFIQINPLSGVGQVVDRYCQMMGGTLCSADTLPPGEDVFVFVIPTDEILNLLDQVIEKSRKVIVMTVCETDPVHPSYGKLFSRVKKIAVPSEFSKNIFEKYWPDNEFQIIRHTVRPDSYKFYTIGNLLDPRKNALDIIKAFVELKLDNAKLFLKSTARMAISFDHPDVIIMNNLVDKTTIDMIHKGCDCYIQFSKSEGVGMGAVEAAYNDKPVIIQEHGGTINYIKTPWIVSCTTAEVEADDFLFVKGSKWGKPCIDELKKHMLDVYSRNIRTWDHEYTRNLINDNDIKRQFENW